jgi:predicted RNA-binding protein with TRAM domain
VTITGFGTETLAVNNDFAWMGDKAKREFSDQYNADIKPGETYEIPIQMTIPEKVSGIRPSGKYTITVNILLDGKTIGTKIVNTQVK